MNTELKITKDSAHTVYISHPTASYAIFCYNSLGDLFMNSDWATLGFAWRSYGNNFEEFLKSLDVDYMVGKFEYNLRFTTKKGFTKRQSEMITILCQEFINCLKNENTCNS